MNVSDDFAAILSDRYRRGVQALDGERQGGARRVCGKSENAG